LPKPHVLIAGGGIGGLATALTLHQIGVPFTVLESVTELRPLGVGINLQPNAVRELDELGISGADLDRVGIPAREWALVGRNGNDIYAEARGLAAGYNWPQYAVHRDAGSNEQNRRCAHALPSKEDAPNEAEQASQTECHKPGRHSGAAKLEPRDNGHGPGDQQPYWSGEQPSKAQRDVAQVKQHARHHLTT
jgi:hypothetical protein